MRACPGESVLNALAASDEATAAVRRHVARCTSCRDRIKHMRENDRFLVHAADALAEALRGEAQPQAPSRPMPERDSIPGYRIVEEISRGGQGVVYRAFQTDTKRPAAIKMLLAGAFATSRQLHRFERETELAAGLRHPNIVTIFQSGAATDGGRYVAMEFVQGVPLDDYVEDTLGPASGGSKARTDAVMRLMVQVARGVGHAHSAGVIHRDIKPSNILVDEQGVPRVLDFGLARSASAASNAPVTESFAGTPAYAAPERLNEQHERTDARSDVYSMGMMLYRLLTGVSPYPCDGPIAAVARHAAETTPMPPSRAVPRLPKDVQTIVLRCLAKDPQRRYASASALAEDLEDYLVGNPISARRDSATYVLRKLILRNRAASAAVAVVALTVLIAAIGFALLAADLDRSRRDAEAALSDSTVQRARMMALGGDTEQAEVLLWGEAIRAGVSCDGTLCFSGSPEVLRSAWSLVEFYSNLPRVMRARLAAQGSTVGFHANTRSVWAIDDMGSKSTWTLDGKLVSRTPVLASMGSAAVASANGRYAITISGRAMTAWDLASGEAIGRHALESLEAGVMPTIDNNGTTIAIMHEPATGSLSIREARSGASLALFHNDIWFQRAQHDHTGALVLLVGTQEAPRRRVIVRRPPDWHDSTDIQLPVEFHIDPTQGVRWPTLSPDGTRILAAVANTLALFDVSSDPILLATHEVDSKEVDKLDFDPSGDSAIMIDRDGLLINLSLPDITETDAIETGRRAIAMAIAEEPAIVGITHPDKSVAVYEPARRRWLTRVESTAATHASIACAPDGTLIWGDDTGLLHVRSTHPPFTMASFPAHHGVITSVALSPDGSEILSTGFDGTVVIHRVDGSPVRTVAEGLPRGWCARFSRDGRSIAAGLADGTVHVWSNEAGAPSRVYDFGAGRIPKVEFSPDGRSLLCAAVSVQQEAVLLELSSGEVRSRFGGHGEFSRAVAWSPDGTLAVTSGDDRTLRVWDAASGTLLRTIAGLPWGPYDLAFHPEGRVLFAVGPGASIIVVDPHAGVELAKLPVHVASIFSIALSPDGTKIFTSGEDSWISITDLDHLRGYIRGNEGYWRSASAVPDE